MSKCSAPDARPHSNPLPAGEGEVKQDGAGDTDAALVDRFLRGDIAAFERIVVRHRPHVRRLAHRLIGWRGDGDDVAQDVFVTVWEQLHRLRSHDTLRAWLMAITIHRCRKQQRGWLSRWRAITGRAAQRPIETAPPADGRLAERDEQRRVIEATRKLSPAEREVIVLHYLEQHSVAKVSELLSVSVGAVEVRLHRARRRLRTLLEKNECAELERKS